mgnify:CR=1 FL=1
MNYFKGQITFVHLIGWGLTLALGVTGAFWSKIGMTDNQVEEVKVGQSQLKERTASVEEAIRTIKDDNKEIKADIKILLQRTK